MPTSNEGSIVRVVANWSEASVEDDPVRALELRLERETAVLIERLERQADTLERLELELTQTREQRDAAQAVAGHLDSELNELTLRLDELTLRHDEVTLELNERTLLLAQASEELPLVRASASWRLTRPLRWAYRAVGRG